MQLNMTADRESNHPDFRVTRLSATTWRIRPVSGRAQTFLNGRFLTKAPESPFVTDLQATNDLVALFRSHGYATEYVGPRGPIRL